MRADGSDTLMDHLPIKGAFKHKKKRAYAVAAHGRTLRTDVRSPRETPRSRTLSDFDSVTTKRQADRAISSKVHAIKAVRK